MNCADPNPQNHWPQMIDAYVDRELAPADAAAFRAHAQTCGPCAAAALDLFESKGALKDAAARYGPSEDFRARMRANLAESATPAPKTSSTRAKRPSSNWTVPLATAALLLLLIGAYFLSAHRQSHESLTELADLHVSTLASANPVEVVSTDRHTVKPWFQGRVPFTFDLPELAGSPFALLGGRVTYLHQQPGAHLIFSSGRHLISVFIFADTPQLALPTSLPIHSASTFNLRTFTRSGLRYIVLGDANPATLQDLSNRLQHAQ